MSPGSSHMRMVPIEARIGAAFRGQCYLGRASDCNAVPAKPGSGTHSCSQPASIPAACWIASPRYGQKSSMGVPPSSQEAC